MPARPREPAPSERPQRPAGRPGTPDHRTPMCLYCGFRHAALAAPGSAAALRCPCCQADLYARPPRSYADLEGLTDLLPPPPTSLASRAAAAASRLARGLFALSSLIVMALLGAVRRRLGLARLPSEPRLTRLRPLRVSTLHPTRAAHRAPEPRDR
jgi:hypothetical protein